MAGLVHVEYTSRDCIWFVNLCAQNVVVYLLSNLTWCLKGASHEIELGRIRNHPARTRNFRHLMQLFNFHGNDRYLELRKSIKDSHSQSYSKDTLLRSCAPNYSKKNTFYLTLIE